MLKLSLAIGVAIMLASLGPPASAYPPAGGCHEVYVWKTDKKGRQLLRVRPCPFGGQSFWEAMSLGGPSPGSGPGSK